MIERKPYQYHLPNSDALVTPYAAVRAGFVALALERNRRATPHVEEARILKAIASQVSLPQALLKIDEIQPALLKAAGVSDKAAGHFLQEHKQEAIDSLIQHFLEPAGKNFVEELVFRFLLTKGDTLGGSMRNIGGILAQRKLVRSIIATLTLSGIPYYWLHKTMNSWIPMTEDDVGIEEQLRGISWEHCGRKRTMLTNLMVPLVKNNIDLCLLDCSHHELTQPLQKAPSINTPSCYIALGELKGGIDPAGADEHWKTAGTALVRIRNAFQQENSTPQIFFIAAAIAKRMANELWVQLEQDTLHNAANLTNTDQVSSLVAWLCQL